MPSLIIPLEIQEINFNCIWKTRFNGATMVTSARRETVGKMTDWETAFESQLIPLIESAKTTSALKECARLVIIKLFVRDGDDTSESLVDELLPDAGGAGGGEADVSDDKKRKIIRLLRDIKDERTRKAEEYKAQQIEEEAEADRRSAEVAELAAAEDDAIKKVFSDVCWDVVRERLDVLQNGVPQDGESLPFILSTAFASRYESMVREHLIATMAIKCRGIIVRTGNQPADKQVDYMRDSFEDKKGRELLWNTWQEVWDDLMCEKEPPEKPKGKKKGLMGMLKREEKKPIGWATKKELTLEEWQAEVEKTKASNKLSRKLWDQLLEDSGGYQPPLKEDGKMLKELFGRSATGLKKQIDALRQIAQQGGNVGKERTHATNLL